VRVLITGITGFVGPHLARHIAETVDGVDIWGLVWSAENATAPPSVRQVDGDLSDFSSLKSALETARPDVVFHLAAASSVAGSWDNPGHFIAVNAAGTANLLEAVRALRHEVRIIVASSAEIYLSLCSQQSCPGSSDGTVRSRLRYGHREASFVPSHRPRSTSTIRRIELCATDRSNRTRS
jgi:nucleoside-diphosphate-sugar epimerase